MFSGGIGSWAAAKRVAAEHGTADLTLLFTDTLIEDEDLYRFLSEAAANVGGALVKLAEGRDPWQVFADVRFLGNSRVDPCSRVLKREMSDKWLIEHCDPTETTVYVGIDWSEIHRYDREPGTRNPKDKGGLKQRKALQGWHYEAPLCSAPYLTKGDMIGMLKAEGIVPPRLYALGFAHNNCGGFCVKAGFGHFANLLRQMPERYAFHEAKEQEFMAMVGRDDIAILKRQKGRGDEDYEGYKPVTLKMFREEVEAGKQVDMFDLGGCGCFTTTSEDDAA
jgi:hypothetical protein